MSGKEQKKVLLFGLGAIGGFYAFILSKNPTVSLSVVARSNYEAIKQKGLALNSPNHGSHTIHPSNVLKSPSDATEKFDYIVLAHKAINPDSIPHLFKSCTNDNTTFVIIQNGVGNEEPFRSTYPKNTIMSCVTWTGAVQTSSGVIEHGKNEDMQIGLFPNASLDSALEKQRLDDFAALLTKGGTKFNIEENIQIKRWEKVVWNAAWNPLTTLTGIPVQSYLKSAPDAMQVSRQLMYEVFNVARKSGVPLKEGLVDELVNKVLAMETPIYSSMYQDAKEGRPLEKEVILGVPMRKARELGIEGEVPVLRTIWSLIGAVDLRIASKI